MSFVFCFVLLFFCSGFASTAMAQQGNQTLDRCAARTHGTPELNDCVSKEYDRADLQLNRAYRLLSARLNQNRRKALRNEQREWNKKRERTCEEEAAEWNGGTGQTAAYGSCLVKQTKARTIKLNRSRK